MALSTITDTVTDGIRTFDDGINYGHAINVGHNERLASLVGGGVLAILGFRRADLTGAALALAGGALVARGLSGYCPVKTLVEEWTPNSPRAIPAQDVDEGRNRFSRHPGDIYEPAHGKECVDETLEESFPASDPPSHSPGSGR